ncbi:MAG: DUF4129 domain-containing protein [Sporichthyaceae bacterium]
MIARVPVELGREEAARLAHEELAKEVYRAQRPGLLRRLLGWLVEQAGHLLDKVAGVSPGGRAGLLVLVLLAVVVIVAIRLKVGPLGRQAASDPALFTGRARTSAEHRAAADAHAARGEWAEAVRERLRAVVRALEERAVLDERPGRTADEAAAEAGAVLPACADDLRRAARLFDDVWYGGRPAGPDADAGLRALDGKVRESRPQPAGSRP